MAFEAKKTGKVRKKRPKRQCLSCYKHFADLRGHKRRKTCKGYKKVVKYADKLERPILEACVDHTSTTLVLEYLYNIPTAMDHWWSRECAELRDLADRSFYRYAVRILCEMFRIPCRMARCGYCSSWWWCQCPTKNIFSYLCKEQDSYPQSALFLQRIRQTILKFRRLPEYKTQVKPWQKGKLTCWLKDTAMPHMIEGQSYTYVVGFL